MRPMNSTTNHWLDGPAFTLTGVRLTELTAKSFFLRTFDFGMTTFTDGVAGASFPKSVTQHRYDQATPPGSVRSVRVLVIDNHDSFVFNLVQYLGQLGAQADVWRNDDPRLGGSAAVASAVGHYDGVLLSPGPGIPQRAGASVEIVGACAVAGTPLLGVCLGHQAIGVAFGATVDRAPELLHGKTSTVVHTDDGVLQGLPNPFTATRYHTLTIVPGSMPPELDVTAKTSGGVIMAVRHVDLPIHGVQFHPESILTEGGHRVLANWLGYCGAAPAESLVGRLEQEVAETVRLATRGEPGATHERLAPLPPRTSAASVDSTRP